MENREMPILQKSQAPGQRMAQMGLEGFFFAGTSPVNFTGSATGKEKIFFSVAFGPTQKTTLERRNALACRHGLCRRGSISQTSFCIIPTFVVTFSRRSRL